MPDHDYCRDLMGSADARAEDTIIAGGWNSFTVTYTAGRFGIDDLGGIKVAMRTHSDMTPLQTEEPTAPGYLTVEASNGAPLDIDFSYKRNIRPWGNCIRILCKRFLKPGDQLLVRIGDRRHGGAGVRMQTHVENAFQFRVTVDAFAAVDYTPLPEAAQPTVRIMPGAPAVWKALAPTLRGVGEAFRLVVKAEDRWGNPTNQFSGPLAIEAWGRDEAGRRAEQVSVRGLPVETVMAPGAYAAVLDGLAIDTPGEVEFVARTPGGDGLCQSNPLAITPDPAARHYWSDMHGQSGETIGSGTAEEYFHFAKHRSFVDIAGHQGNDFQITDAFWEEINRLTAAYEEEGVFLCIPGYEWSGNTGLGGDHNIWYRREGGEIYRSSRALIADRTRPDSDRHDVRDLFETLRGEDVLVVPHVGGRFADVGYAHDATLEPSVEVHSSWGTFDWILRDSLERGYRVGIVAASDGHKGRPGASYPGDAKFGSYGGLTCHLLPELTRDALFEQFRRRRHYATTGTRLILETRLTLPAPALIHARNPDVAGPAAPAPERSATALMGDIVETASTTGTFAATVSAASPIERIEIHDGLQLLETIRPHSLDDDAAGQRRLRVLTAGQETRGRGRLVVWDVTAAVDGARIARIAARNFFNPDRQPRLESATTACWRAVTTGGFSAVDLWLEDVRPGATLSVETSHGALTVAVDEIDQKGRTQTGGGLDKRLGVQRLPVAMTQRRFSLRRDVTIPADRDGAFYLRATLEDGHVAWSSPIYAFRPR